MTVKKLAKTISAIVLFAFLSGVPSLADDVSKRQLLAPSTQGALAFSKNAQVQSNLMILRSQAVSSGKVGVIVGLRVPFAPEGLLTRSEIFQQKNEIESSANSLFSRLKARGMVNENTFQKFSFIPFVSMQVTADELDFLKLQSDVLTIEPDRVNKRFLAESTELIGATDAWASGYTGDQQTVAILDTGVDKTHAFLSDRVVSEACYSGGGSYSNLSLCPGRVFQSTAAGSGMPCSDGCEHGTHVAGIAAGSGDDFSGVAPDANIIAIQVFSGDGNGEVGAFDSDIILGLQRVYTLRNSYAIASANMSLGGGRYYSYCDSQYVAMKAAIDNLRSVGTATVIASGNEKYTDSMGSPACISSSISVGATWKEHLDSDPWCSSNSAAFPDKVTCFSNSASFLDLLAPGAMINSSVPDGSFESWPGTSMAAPHVAGAWAVIKQKDPTATVDEVLSALKDTGTLVTDTRNGIETPRIDVMAALESFADTGFDIAYTKSGTGSGTVSFSPSGTKSSCAANCSNRYSPGNEVTLTASASAGSTFAGWSGNACSGTSSCVLTMSADRAVSATFNTIPKHAIVYTKTGSGSGTVSFSPSGTKSSCAANCSNKYNARTRVTLRASASAGSTFAGWSGSGCSGTGSCVLTMSSAKAVRATFNARPTHSVSYTRAGTGSGTVSFAPSGTLSTCAANCSNSYSPGTRVTLRASASAGSTFAGWSGSGCSGKGSCVLTMSSAKAVRATFTGPTCSGLGCAVESTLTWQTYYANSKPFFSQTIYKSGRSGASAARSGLTENSGITCMSTVVQAPGNLSWIYSVSSEYGYDGIALLIDDVVYEAWTGLAVENGSWFEGAGRFSGNSSHTVTFCYVKDSTFSSGLDAGFVDRVSYVRTGSSSAASNLTQPTIITISPSRAVDILGSEIPEGAEKFKMRLRSRALSDLISPYDTSGGKM